MVNFKLTRLQTLAITRVGPYKNTYNSNSLVISIIISHFDSSFCSLV